MQYNDAALDGIPVLAPGHILPTPCLAGYHREQGVFAHSAALYRQLLDNTPHDIQLWMLLGDCYFRAGNHSQAVDSYERVLEIDPTHALARDNLERVLQDKAAEFIRQHTKAA